MKLKNYKELLNEERGEEDEFDNTSDSSDFGDSEYYGEEDEESMYDDDYDDYDDDYEEEEVSQNEPTSDDVLEHLASLIRQMIKLANIEDYYVTTNEYDLSIQFVLNKTERFSKLIKIMGLLKKLTTDTLIQYESELDLWETKEGHPLLTVDFYYDSKKSGSFKKDDVPF
jgi:hypothetical protein